MRTLLARLLIVVVIALVPALAFQAYTEIQASHVRQQLLEDEALRLLHLVSSEQQQIIEGAEQVLDVLGGAPAVQDNLSDYCRRLLSAILMRAPRYTNVAIIGLDGRVTCTPEQTGIGMNLSDRSYFQDALRTGGVVIGEYAIGRITGKPVLPIAKRFHDSVGNVAGVVEIGLSLDWLGHQLDRVSLPKGAFARIADRNGIVLAHQTKNERFTGKPIPEDVRFSLEGNAAAVTSVHAFDGRMRIMAYAPVGVGSTGLAVAVGLDPEAAFAHIDRANRIGLTLIVAGGGLALLLTAVVGNHLIRRPVAQLLDAAANWRAGALAVRTNLRKDDSEFGRLATAFDGMAAALEAREQALRMALESTTDAVIAVDKTWRLTYLNQHAWALTDGRDLLGQPFWGAFPDLEQPEFVDACRTAMSSGWPTKIETRSHRTHKQYVTNGYPSEDGLTLFVRDVTEERRVAMALSESETRLQLVLDAAGFGVWTRDVVSGASDWSDQQWRLHGYEPRQDGPDLETWASMVHPEDREGVLAARQAAIIDPGQPVSNERRVVWPNGAVHWLLTRATVIRDATGQAVRIVGVCMDVTASRETEAALRRLSSDLEQRVQEEVAAREVAQARVGQVERVQALGQLAGGIAHDFNNILQAVSGAMTLIERRPGDEAVIRRLARLANDATARGASVTRRLLTFGRGGDLLVEVLDLPALLRGLQEVLSHTLGAGIAVSVKLGADLPPIKADKRQLETVLVNLATNARDAMTEGGRLVLSAEAEIVSAQGPRHSAGVEPGSYVRLSVSDTGIGMNAETLARAREPFFTTKKLGAGTGLGLAMAQTFAEQSGGALSLEGRESKGTTVTLWLRQADVEDTGMAGGHLTVAAPIWPPGPAAPLRVLLVDDEDVIREVLAHYLEDAGYSVLPAANGAEALALLASEPKVDALITDLSMLGMDGLAVIRAAREHYPALPAILLTGYAGDDAALVLGRSIGGAVSLLRKPVSDVQLLDCLSAMLAAGGEDKRSPAYAGGVRHPPTEVVGQVWTER
jgi:PAS domain S-box-containing protein